MAGWGAFLGMRNRAVQTPAPEPKLLYITTGQLLDQAAQPLYRQRLVRRNVGVAYENPTEEDPLLAVGTLSNWQGNGGDITLQFTNCDMLYRNGWDGVRTQAAFAPQARVCEGRRDFLQLADKVAALIMEVNSRFAAPISDYHRVVDRARRELPA